MKKYIAITLFFAILLLPCADAQQFTVRTVYFQPTDAPAPVNREIINLLIESKDFYRDEMSRHGYGLKTFTLETDPFGNVGFHIVKGKHNSDHYLTDSYNRVKSELPLNLSHVANLKDNVLVIIVAGIPILNTGNRGYGGYYLGNNTGGFAILVASTLTFEVLSHEIGHTFALNHATDPRAVMWAGSDILLDYETRWLDRHPFFNKTHTQNNAPRYVKSLPVEAIEDNKVRFKIVAESTSGLYQAQLMRKRGGFIIGASETQGKSATIKIDVSRELVVNGDNIDLQMMDINGNKMLKNLGTVTLPAPLPEPKPEVVVEIEVPEDPEVQVDKKEVEPEEPEMVIVECPECELEGKTDLSVNPHHLLTTQWANFKRY